MTDGLTGRCRRAGRRRGRHRAHACDGWLSMWVSWAVTRCSCPCHNPTSAFRRPRLTLDADLDEYAYICRRADLATVEDPGGRPDWVESVDDRPSVRGTRE